MLNTVSAVRLIGEVGSGKTKPLRVEALDSEGQSYELVLKYSSGCQEKEKSLILEAVVAMLAADLGLPVPEPFVVKIEQDFIGSIHNTSLRERLTESCNLAFGSKHFPAGFAIWQNGQMIPGHLVNDAAEIFVFDAIIINSDRRPENPNCFYSGTELAIVDHELTFNIVFFWKAPWVEGGFDSLIARERHIFAKPYFETPPENLDRFIAAWESIPDTRFDEYKNAIPPEWIKDEEFLDELMSKLREAKLNIRLTVDNALEALS